MAVCAGGAPEQLWPLGLSLAQHVAVACVTEVLRLGHNQDGGRGQCNCQEIQQTGRDPKSRFLEKSALPYDPATPLLGVNLKELEWEPGFMHLHLHLRVIHESQASGGSYHGSIQDE